MTREAVSVRPPASVTVIVQVTDTASPVLSRLYTDATVIVHAVDMAK